MQFIGYNGATRRSSSRLLMVTVIAVALLAGALGLRDARAQFVYVNDKAKPADLVGFKYVKGTPPTLPAIPDATALLTGTLGTQGRWTVGDLDLDGKPEIILPFSVLAQQSHVVIWTFDPAASYSARSPFDVFGDAGRQFTGDLDGDGGDELLLADFGSDPATRPPGGGTDVIRVVNFDSLAPMSFHTFQIPNQFFTPNSQFAARDLTGDKNAEILVLSQNEAKQNAFGEPAGAATLFACTPTLGTPSSCAQLFSVNVPAAADGRYPTSVAVADFDGDRFPDVVIGYGSSCQTSDVTLSMFHPRTQTFSGPFTLGRAFQHVTADDLDRDGIPELIATVGTQPGGGAGAVQAYHFDTASRTFQLLVETPANLPGGTANGGCVGSPFPAVSFEPVAAVGVVPVPPPIDICDGLDNDGDGKVDEDCFLRFLFVPWCFTGNDAAFKAAAEKKLNFFIHAVGLDTCAPRNVYAEYMKVGQVNLGGACGADAHVGLRERFVAASAAVGGPDINKFTVAIALTNDLAVEGFVAGQKFADDMLWVKDYPPGALSGSGRIIDGVDNMAHELGHITGLDEEYCREDLPMLSGISPACQDAQSINIQEARLGCAPPPATTCCTPSDGFCEGNVPPGLPTGRCIMSHSTAGRLPGETPAPRGYCENCLNHLKKRPPTSGQPFVPLEKALDCASIYDGDLPLLNLTAKPSTGPSPQIVQSQIVDSGRRPLSIPRKIGAFRLNVYDAAGTSLYETAFDNQEFKTVLDGADPTPQMGPFQARVMLPPTLNRTAPMPVTVSKGGVVLTKVTLNGQAPAANAGPDQTIECNSPQGGQTQLDGTASSDPDGDTLNYIWTSTADVHFDNPAADRPIVTVPVGTRSIALEVTDSALTSPADFVQVTVRDTKKPVFPATLATLDASVCRAEAVTLPKPSVTDACDATLTITGVVIRSNGQTVNVPVPADGRVTLAVGRHTVRWTAADDTGNNATADQLVDVRPAFLANGVVDFADRAQLRAGSNYAALANTGTGTGTYGVSAHTGDLLANGNIVLRGTRVHGSVTTTGTISKQLGAVVDGQERPRTNPNLSVFAPPAVTFPAPTGDLIVAKNTTASATPGSYGKVDVDQNATLTLAPGDYYFDRLILEQSTSRLVIDQRTGPVRLFIRLELTDRGTIATLPANGTTFIRYTGTQTAFLEGAYTGTIVAMSARVVVRKPYTGSLAAHDIQVEPDITLQCAQPALPISFAGRGVAALDPAGAGGEPASAEVAASGEAAPSETAAGEPSAGCAIGATPHPTGQRSGRAWGALAAAVMLAAVVFARRRQR